MPPQIPTGTLFTYKSSDWKTNYFTTTGDIVNQVAALLAQNGMTIRDHTESVQGVVGNIDAYIGGPAQFSVVLTVQITGGTGYASIDDPASIIDHFVYQVTGTLPTHSVTDFTVPNSLSVGGFFGWVKSLFSGKQSTGQPAPASTGFSLSSITSSGTLWIGLVILGFVGALALIGYSGALKRGPV